MSNQRILTLYPYLYPGTACWVFDDARTGLKEEAFVEGTSEMITRVIEQKKIARAAKGFPFDWLGCRILGGFFSMKNIYKINVK